MQRGFTTALGLLILCGVASLAAAGEISDYYSDTGYDSELSADNSGLSATSGTVSQSGCAQAVGCSSCCCGNCDCCGNCGCCGNSGCYGNFAAGGNAQQGSRFNPWSMYLYQTADYVTNVTLPGRIYQNPINFSFLNSPNDVFSGVPGNLLSGGLASGILQNVPGGGAVSGINGMPLIPYNTLTNTVTTLLPGGLTGYLNGLLGGGQPGTISVTPAFHDDWQYQTAGGAFYQLPLGSNVSFTTGVNYY